MHKSLEVLVAELELIASDALKVIPSTDPFNVAQNNWSFPGLNRQDISRAATSLVEFIRAREDEEVDSTEMVGLEDFQRRLVYLRTQTLPQMWGSAAQAVPAYMETMRTLRQALERTFKPEESEQVKDALRRLRTQVRSMEARASDLGQRSENLGILVDRIERAGIAADQLPTDLEELERARKQIETVQQDAARDAAAIKQASAESSVFKDTLTQLAGEAEAVLARANRAYAAASSQGLAAAFTERSKSLSVSIRMWTFGLIIALCLGAYIGADQLESLGTLIRTPGVSPTLVFINLILALVSVGAPVWFAWLATKQVSQSFRLSEDYAFKAAVSRAYEGYRREAERIDAETQETEMEARLLGSALDRLDEQPLRVVDPSTPGSPWHELMSSDAVKAAVKSVPSFVGEVKQLALRLTDKGRRGEADEYPKS